MPNNPMKDIRIEKITLNVGAGKDQTRLEKGMKMLKSITGINPIKTVSNKRIPAWGVRPGLPIGCKITLRRQTAEDMLKRLLKAKENILTEKQFDENGNVSFGIPEYIDIEGAKYDPEIKVMGLEVCITLERRGYRIKKRRIQRRKVNKKHLIKKDEAIEFMKSNFKVKVGEE